MAITELQGSASPVSADVPAVGEGRSVLDPGSRVQVRRRFDAKWARGFEVLEHQAGLYRVRRLSDGETLPVWFPGDELRLDRADNTWWY
jgi:hypothetical protein